MDIHHSQKKDDPPVEKKSKGGIAILAMLLLAIGSLIVFNITMKGDAGPLFNRDARYLDREARKPPETVSVVNAWTNDPLRTPDGGYVPLPVSAPSR